MAPKPDAGESPTLKLDLTNVLEEVVSHKYGLTDRELQEWAPRLEEAWKGVLNDEPGFLDLPHRDDLLAETRSLEDRLDGMTHFVLLGIGGSALGPRAIFEAAFGPYGAQRVGKPDGPKRHVYVADNIDPDGFSQILEGLDLSRTLFNVISKSGSTVETMAQWSIAWRKVTEAVGPKKAARHFVFTTDPESGFLREAASRLGVPALRIPPEVGGRFSVLSPVGLFPALAMGARPEALLEGARAMDVRCQRPNLDDNPAAVLAIIHFLADRLRGANIAVMMPYSDRLRTFAEWFAQLWAESLGKSRTKGGDKKAPVGQTPVRALGVTDQHSQIQLYVDGPHDKLITLLAVEQSRGDLPLGAPEITGEGQGLAYLDGHSLGEVFRVEQVATEMALARAGRSTLVWRMPHVDESVLGQLFHVYAFATAIAGNLYDVDAYDQPGVEEGKQLTYGALGREGYEAREHEISSYRAREALWVLE